MKSNQLITSVICSVCSFTAGSVISLMVLGLSVPTSLLIATGLSLLAGSTTFFCSRSHEEYLIRESRISELTRVNGIFADCEENIFDHELKDVKVTPIFKSQLVSPAL